MADASASAKWLFVCAAILLSFEQTATGDLLEFVPRNFSGIGNNIANPSWGSTRITQVRAVAGADYADGVSTPPGDDRPTAREVTTDVFLSSTATVSTKSAVFIAWGQLITYDLSLTVDNVSEPFDIPCDDGGVSFDAWCPLGENSEDISFDRSNATESNSTTRNPVNYATSFIDLDFMYGRSDEEADRFRTMEGGFMNVTETGVPFRNTDGTWMIPDQRTARFPVTFALHIMLLLEHNRCCIDVAPTYGYEGDEDVYQACRGWTIAIFQHMIANDFIIQLMGDSIYTLGRESSTTTSTTSTLDPSSDTTGGGGRQRRRRTQGLTSSWYNDDSTDRGTRERPQQPLESTAIAAGRPQLSPELVAGGESTRTAISVHEGLDDAETTAGNLDMAREGSGARRAPELHDLQPRRRLYDLSDYDNTVNPAADVFTLTAGAAAFESALASTVRIVSEGYVSVAEDHVELTVACNDMAGLFERNDVGDILRGAVLTPALEIDTYYSAVVSNLSPLFKLPVDAVQRGRDHGLPTYNSVREAYGLTAAADFADITADASVAALISDAYGGDIENVDAITGALAEDADGSTGGVLGDLLREAWIDQLFRTIAGDRMYHYHGRTMETVSETTLSDVVNRTLNVTDLPLSMFAVPGVTVCASDCETVGEAEVTPSDSFGIAWEMLDEDIMSITLKAKDIGAAGMLGIGWGGVTMFTAQDYVVCEVISATEGECIDRSTVSTREVPSPDLVNAELNVTGVSVADDWTSITFLRDLSSLDDEDYNLKEDIDNEEDTLVIYSYREGAGVGQHPNGNRGASTVNFATGDAETVCDDSDNFASLHGALMLFAWLILAPIGIYFIRYRKGDTVNWAGRQWYEMHQEIMIVTAEAVLPLGVTAVVASGGDHSTEHAHWGYYMIAAVAAQVFTGWMRTKELEGKYPNFSFLHRCNKHFHIWSGRFAYLAGVVQCYRGLELVSDNDELLFSTVDGVDLHLGSFSTTKHYLFPVWLAAILIAAVYLESRKQLGHFFKEGSAHVCSFVTVINEGFAGAQQAAKSERLIPRTGDQEIYTVMEFNDKVLNGQSWVVVDGAILDVTNFSQRHPGGTRLIQNAVGTDVTHELLGESLSVGHAMSFSPHIHPEEALKIARTLVVGYIEEEDGGEQPNQTQPMDEGHRKEEGEHCRGCEDDPTEEEKFTEAQPPAPAEEKGDLALGKPGVRSWGEDNSAVSIDALADTARRLNRLTTFSVMPTVPKHLGPLTRKGAAAVAQSNSAELQSDTISQVVPKHTWSGRHLLEMFHVCPLLFRQKMESPSGTSPSSDSPSARPVYRYIFSCPGEAQALVEAMAGVCYVNMRAQDPTKGVVQRSYNAFAVRVHESRPSTTGRGLRGAHVPEAGMCSIVPAELSTGGTLCVELRIRLHHDGMMSRLLERLASNADNPAVQLQGPFFVKELVPPPAYRNVVMIAAGTGINPMVQQIGLYLALPRDDPRRSRSRLALVWQCASDAELCGAHEIAKLKARSNGRLEVTFLTSGRHRRRNVPGSALARAKKSVADGARNFISPAISFSTAPAAIPVAPKRSRWRRNPSGRSSDNSNNNSNGNRTEGGGDQSIKTAWGGKPPSMPEDRPLDEAALGESLTAAPDVSKIPDQHPSGGDASPSDIADPAMFGPRPRRMLSELTRELRIPSREALRPAGISLTGSTKNMADELMRNRVHGKVTRDVLDNVFGPTLLATLGGHGKRPATDAEGSLTSTYSEGNRGADAEEKLAELGGENGDAENLQVVVSGPRGFVKSVEAILTEMGVPSRAMALLD